MMSAYPVTTTSHLKDMLLESPESSPVSHSPKIAPIPAIPDDGVFMLEDEDGDDVDEEEVPDESTGRHADMCVDFGLSMTEYDPEEYVPTNKRSFDTESPKNESLQSPTKNKQEEFLGTSFTGSPRLQSALQSLHQQTKCRSRTNSDINTMPVHDRFAGAGELRA
jgi:hypothetical protein